MFLTRWPNPALAEELTQKTVFDAVRGLKSYDLTKGSPEEWITGIARNNIRLEIRKFQIEVKNTRRIPVKIEIQRNFDASYWDIHKTGQFDKFEKVDLDTVKFTLTLKPRSVKKFEYTLRTYHGTRTEDWQQ